MINNNNGFGMYVKMWPGLINKAKEAGLDAVETYVFWNGHEPHPGRVRHLPS